MVSHCTEPSFTLTAATLPLSKPQSTRSPLSTGQAVPRSDSRGTCCSCDHSSWPSFGASPRSLPSVGAQRDQPLRYRRRGENLAVDANLPANGAVVRFKRDDVTDARSNHDHSGADPGTAGQRQLGLRSATARGRIPDRMPRPRPYARPRTRDCHPQPDPSPRRKGFAPLSATAASQTFLTLQGRAEYRQLRRLIDVLVLRAGASHEASPPGTQRDAAS